MTVAFDAYSTSASFTAGTVSWTHTPVGTPRGVLVGVLSGPGADDVNVVTYGGVSCIEVPNSPYDIVTGSELDDDKIHWFHLGSSIPTGAQTVQYTTNGVGPNQRGFAVSLTGAADTEVVDDVPDSGTAANPSVTLALAGRDSFAALQWFSGQNATTDVTPLTNWTSRHNQDLGSLTAGLFTYDTIGSTDVTAGFTATIEQYGIYGIAVSEVAAGVAVIPVFAQHFRNQGIQ